METWNDDQQIASDGSVYNGFDYCLQVWVIDGICQDVGTGRANTGAYVNTVPGHEVRNGS